MLITKSFLREQSSLALQSCGGNRKNMCDAVVNELSYSLNEEFNYNTHSPVKAPVNGRKHFVCLISSDETEFCDSTGYVVVDPTIKQFESRDNREYPSIAIIEPGDSRLEWYDTILYP